MKNIVLRLPSGSVYKGTWSITKLVLRLGTHPPNQNICIYTMWFLNMKFTYGS
jgi:hypothetical protein